MGCLSGLAPLLQYAEQVFLLMLDLQQLNILLLPVEAAAALAVAH